MGMMMSVLDKRNFTQSTMEEASSSTSNIIPPAPKVIKTVKEAFSTLLEVAVKGIFEGMFPHIERQRREAIEDRKTIIDIVLNFFGALIGRQQCSEIIACRTGKFVGYQVPGAGVIMMMLEGIVPLSIRNWFEVVKNAVLDKTDNCETDFLCSIVDVY